MSSGAKLVETVGPIWRRWERYVFGAFRRIVGSSAAAEDLTQQVFLAVCEAVQRDEDIRDPQAYLGGTIAHLLRQHFEEQERKMSLYEEKEPDACPAGELGVAHETDAGLVRDLLNRLTWQDRYIVVAWHYLDMTREQIGQTLNLPRTTINRRYADAILKMRWMAKAEAMEPLGGCEQ